MKRILLIDPDLGVVLWLGDILGNAGYAVVPATSVQEAAKLISELSYEWVDLVLADASLDTTQLLNGLAAMELTGPPTVIRRDIKAEVMERSVEDVAQILLRDLHDRLFGGSAGAHLI